jgi:2-haloacid dehalogenase
LVGYPAERFEAVLFDLLTALIDSPTLWNRIAGGAAAGGRWRMAYLRLTYAAGAYRAYEELVAEAAAEAGLPRTLASDLVAAYPSLEPWPEVPGVLRALGRVVPLGVVTNCSETLGGIAVGRTGGDFAVVITAEQPGFYKPHPLPYQMALDRLGVSAERCLFVAGSPYDLFGTAKVGLPTYWHDRTGLAPPADMPEPRWREATLTPLVDLVTNPAD